VCGQELEADRGHQRGRRDSFQRGRRSAKVRLSVVGASSTTVSYNASAVKTNK
jgi:hypothetical protein